MKRAWHSSAKILTGLFVTAMYAMPQANTISAKPGAVNYIEGNVAVNGQPVSAKGLKTTFLNLNDTLSTDVGKAEILLTPGVFLRVGDNSQVRMVSPSLIDTQVELQRGEAIIEVDELVKENHISIVDHGASIIVEKNGLYRFTADDTPKAAVIEGKAEVYFGEKKIDLNKGHETILSDLLKPEKFDSKKEDELYAWSNIRSEYNASASYQTARNAAAGGYNGGLGYGSGYGYGGYGGFGPYGYGLTGPGWYWNSGFDSWSWLPGNGAFFSPFGYGFYGPGLVGYAPVVVVNGLGGRNGWPGHHMVPVNPNNPPAVGSAAVGSNGLRNNLPSHYASPAAYQAARAQAAHSFASTGGFRTASGAAAPTFTGGGGRASTGAQPAAHAGWSGGGGSASSGASHASSSAGSGGGGFHGGGGGSGGGSGGHSK